MNRITVFCGSNSGTEKIYEEYAYLLGKTLASNNIALVYGGSKTGLMGTVANGVIENNGEAYGVLPHFLRSKEIDHENLTELIFTDTMHERKAKMNDLCDGFIALPGGWGTFEELFEILTWAQLGLHRKPVALLNINGFYDDLLSLIQNMVDKGFLSKANQQMLLVSNTVEEMLPLMKNYCSPVVAKWLSEDEV